MKDIFAGSNDMEDKKEAGKAESSSETKIKEDENNLLTAVSRRIRRIRSKKKIVRGNSLSSTRL